jgi:hypothetical protein
VEDAALTLDEDAALFRPDIVASDCADIEKDPKASCVDDASPVAVVVDDHISPATPDAPLEPKDAATESRASDITSALPGRVSDVRDDDAEAVAEDDADLFPLEVVADEWLTLNEPERTSIRKPDADVDDEWLADDVDDEPFLAADEVEDAEDVDVCPEYPLDVDTETDDS